MKLLRNTLVGLSTLSVLFACTPTFQTTSELCQAYLPTRQIAQNYEVDAKSSDTDYKLYFQDFLNSFKDLQSKSVDENGNTVLSALSSEEVAVRDFIFEKINEELKYSVDEEGNVESANNPLDYMASLIATTDSDKLVQTFVEAKQQMANAIAKDDGHCAYSNEQIEFIRENDDFSILDFFNASLDLTYIPSAFVDTEHTVSQDIVISFDETPDSDEEINIQFSATDFISPENFLASGFSEARQQQVGVTNVNTPSTLTINENYLTTKVGTLGYSVPNEECLDDEGSITQCPDGSITRPVAHPKCADGIDSDADSPSNEQYEDEADETDTRILNTFTIVESNEALKDLKRLKVEIDYPNSEIRVYVSKFIDAIYKALDDDGNPIAQGSDNPTPSTDQLIFDPTRCETGNVEKELSDLNDGAVAVATVYEDPDYEYITQTDENGDAIIDDEGFEVTSTPTPLFIFQGTAIQDRQ